MVPVALIVLVATVVLAVAAAWLLLAADDGTAGAGQIADLESTLGTRPGLHPLRDPVRDRFRLAWGRVQQRFVDEPRHGILDADGLVQDAMRSRGYRVPDQEYGVALRPGEPPLVDRYRAAHDVASRRLDPNVGNVVLWRAMVDYQAVLDALLDPPLGQPDSRRT